MAKGVSVTASPGPAQPARAAELRVIPDPIHGSAWITQQLRQAITEGGYRHGEKLPAERQLAEAFHASRTTVRAALNRLDQERLVIRRIGSGTFVNYIAASDTRDVIEQTSPLELIDVRLGVEPHMSRLAVLHATPRDIDRLARAIKQMESGSTDAERFSQFDEQFHLLVAECTHNPLMVSLYRQINEVRGHAQWNAIKGRVLTAERIAEYNRQHRSLFEAIRIRDTDSAAAIITNHLHYARRQLLGIEPT